MTAPVALGATAGAPPTGGTLAPSPGAPDQLCEPIDEGTPVHSCIRGHRHATGPLSLRWRHSTCSVGADQTCVDVALLDDVVAVRDSKEPSGPLLRFTPAEWRMFLCGVKAGEFELPHSADLGETCGNEAT
jgi:hypothetical protein